MNPNIELLEELAALRATLEACAATLPGVTYMDPPDGGQVSIPEQLSRMAEDARLYRSKGRAGAPCGLTMWHDPNSRLRHFIAEVEELGQVDRLIISKAWRARHQCWDYYAEKRSIVDFHIKLKKERDNELQT